MCKESESSREKYLDQEKSSRISTVDRACSFLSEKK